MLLWIREEWITGVCILIASVFTCCIVCCLCRLERRVCSPKSWRMLQREMSECYWCHLRLTRHQLLGIVLQTDPEQKALVCLFQILPVVTQQKDHYLSFTLLLSLLWSVCSAYHFLSVGFRSTLYRRELLISPTASDVADVAALQRHLGCERLFYI